jgi:hypothetical protein
MNNYILDNLINENFIYKYNKDIAHMNKKRLKQHYIHKGHKEGRILSNLHIQQILRNRYFNIEFYKTHYDDVKDMNPTQLVNQYIQFGQKECRIVSKKHGAILTKNPEFDIDVYKLCNPDLRNMNPTQLVNHYIEHGKQEGRIVYESLMVNITDNFKFDTSRIKICIIYVYYERKNEQKNQTNLAFFIKYGLDKSRWRNMDITTLIMINGYQCELTIPETENIHILYNNNEYDVISHKKGIKYFENKYNSDFYNVFTHLLIMNCSVIGPIYEEGLDRHWLDPYLNKLTNNTVLCSPCINFLKKGDCGGPGPRCQSYCSLIKMNKNIYDLLLNTKISNLAPGTTNYSYQLEFDYILGDKNSMHNTILIGEYGITRILLNNGYNISCLIYDAIDYNDQTIWDTYSDRIDRMPDMTVQNFNKQVFIKNYWRDTRVLRDSLPCFYNESIKFMSTKLNYKNICSDLPSVKYNYDLININGSGTLRYSTSIDWNNKERFYNLFGYAEEHIIWPLQQLNNTACVIYFHYDKDNIIKDYVIQALKTLIILEYDVFFCTMSSEIKNIDLPFEIHCFKNNDLSDMYVWHTVMNSIDLNRYSWILLLNDSMLLSIHGIEHMKTTILNMRKTHDFWGLYEYNEPTIHLCRCFIEFNRNSFAELIKLYNKYIISLKTTPYEITKLEQIQTQHLVNQGFTYSAVVRYNYSTHSNSNIMLKHENINILLFNKDCFGIKSNYLDCHIKYDNPYLNYLMRFL